MEENNLLLEKQYKIPFDLFREAFIAFQRRFVYPKTYVIMGILGVVTGFYSYALIKSDENANRGLYCMIILFCVVFMALQFINPRKIRIKLMEGVKEIEDDEYRLRIFPEYLEIGTILPPEDASQSETDALFDDVPAEDFSGTRIHYNKGLNVVEYPKFFMIYQQKTMFYVVPKAAFSEEELEILRVHFSKRLEKTFISHK